MTFAINEVHKIEVEKQDKGYRVQFFELMGNRWVRLYEEAWAKLEDLKDYYEVQ